MPAPLRLPPDILGAIEALRKAVDRAYLRRYTSAWERKYVKDLNSPKSRATTIELRPALPARPGESA